MRPMKRPQPKWWKNCIHKIIRLRNIFVIIIWKRTANCCRLDRAYSLLKNFDSCFIFCTTVPSLGRVFSIWREFIDGLRRKLSESLDITGKHWSLPFWKTFENCGMTVSGSRSQSSMTVGDENCQSLTTNKAESETYCNQLENYISDKRSSDYSRMELMSLAFLETRNPLSREDKLYQIAQTSPPKADESYKLLCGLDALVRVIVWCKMQLLPVSQEWIKRKRCNNDLTSSRPLVGSSRYMIAGSVTSSRAIDNLFRSPPLRTTKKETMFRHSKVFNYCLGMLPERCSRRSRPMCKTETCENFVDASFLVNL